MHPTLLPRHRGRAAIPWAILSGLARTGVTLFEIVDATADSGPIVGQREVPIDRDETATTLYDKVTAAHVELSGVRAAARSTGRRRGSPQDTRRASYWPKRTPADGIIDWETRAPYLYDWVRAQTRPYPGAFTYLGEEKVVVWRARPVELGERAGRDRSSARTRARWSRAARAGCCSRRSRPSVRSACRVRALLGSDERACSRLRGPPRRRGARHGRHDRPPRGRAGRRGAGRLRHRRQLDAVPGRHGDSRAKNDEALRRGGRARRHGLRPPRPAGHAARHAAARRGERGRRGAGPRVRGRRSSTPCTPT